MNKHYDVAVIGAGIIGLGAAYAASRRGSSVIVLDRSDEPNGATIRNFGHLCIGAQTGIARQYGDLARGLWLELAGAANFWIRESGTVVVARHDDELALLAAAADESLTLLTAAEIADLLPVREGSAVGGARIHTDLQTNPREAAAAIRAYLQSQGVEFLLRTSVGSVEPGIVHSSRGDIAADLIVAAVNHDVDQLFPDLADEQGIVRCSLDMTRVEMILQKPLPAPVLTGWSLLRYGRFAQLPEAGPVRERLHTARPDLAALDLNQMYTQLPDGSLIVGDTHVRGASVSPFQPEEATALMLAEAEYLFDAPALVLERWQGVYASGRDEFLYAEPMPGVLALAATTGIGMTCGLGLAETAIAEKLGALTEGKMQ